MGGFEVKEKSADRCFNRSRTAWESRKGSKNRPKRLAASPIEKFSAPRIFYDSRFCLIFSFGGNYEISVETISVETILVETNIFWWKLLLFGGN
jgi:hypothetical protein